MDEANLVLTCASCGSPVPLEVTACKACGAALYLREPRKKLPSQRLLVWLKRSSILLGVFGTTCFIVGATDLASKIDSLLNYQEVHSGQVAVVWGFLACSLSVFTHYVRSQLKNTK